VIKSREYVGYEALMMEDRNIYILVVKSEGTMREVGEIFQGCMGKVVNARS
jgi:hypothetical protein